MCLLIRILICRILVGTTLVLDLHELVSKVLLLKSNASSTMHRFLEPLVYFGPVERPWYNCLVKIVSCKLSSCPILNRHIVSACVYSAVFEHSMWDYRECLLVELIYILGYNIPLFQLSASSLIRFLRFVPRSWSFTSKKSDDISAWFMKAFVACLRECGPFLASYFIVSWVKYEDSCRIFSLCRGHNIPPFQNTKSQWFVCVRNDIIEAKFICDRWSWQKSVCLR